MVRLVLLDNVELKDFKALLEQLNYWEASNVGFSTLIARWGGPVIGAGSAGR
jgi:hypothetical protein